MYARHATKGNSHRRKERGTSVGRCSKTRVEKEKRERDQTTTEGKRGIERSSSKGKEIDKWSIASLSFRERRVPASTCKNEGGERKKGIRMGLAHEGAKKSLP